MSAREAILGRVRSALAGVAPSYDGPPAPRGAPGDDLVAHFAERVGGYRAVGEAGTALGIHRNTATYRLRRIEQLTGWDLGDPDLRLALLVALRLVQDH